MSFSGTVRAWLRQLDESDPDMAAYIESTLPATDDDVLAAATAYAAAAQRELADLRRAAIEASHPERAMMTAQDDPPV